ncbi:adhesion G protein-coupled receptor F4 [Alosa pseudoharengus]|uniref:adhesion G protein-coupled receptor F4 n=1 Tax=Alosa pseudoharengus TaxID=34774 RepID=UPI003F8C6222
MCQDYRCCILAVNGSAVVSGEFKIDNITSNADLHNLINMYLYHLMEPTGKITDVVEVAECVGSGNETKCGCKSDHIWNSTVCADHPQCCNNAECQADVSNYTPLCLPKVNVELTGKIKSKSKSKKRAISGLDSSLENTLNSTFQKMSGYGGDVSVNVSSDRLSAVFSVTLNAVFNTAQLQKLIYDLQVKLTADITVESEGIANIFISEEEPYQLSCDLEDDMKVCSWSLKNKNNKEIVVVEGTETKVRCSLTQYSSTTTLVLEKNARAGLYTCRLISDSILHKASVKLNISEPPDIIMESKPQTADCTEGLKSINVSCKMANDFNFTLSCPDNNVTGNAEESLIVDIPCKDKLDSLKCTCNVTHYDETYSQNLEVPVLKSGDSFCVSENGWPKTKAGSTATQSCGPKRVGKKSRTCDENEDWGSVFNYCVRKDVDNLLKSAMDIAKGYGNTPEEVGNIFSVMTNVTNLENEATLADVEAFINTLGALNTATSNIEVIGDSVMTDFIESATNVLSMDWSGGNKTYKENLSANYLQSVEGLLQNIQVNQSSGYNTTLMQFQVRQKDINHRRTIFNVSLRLSTSASQAKILAIKNLSELLPNRFPDTESSSIVVTVALQSNKSEPSGINLEFPLKRKKPRNHEIICARWQNSMWDKEGCEWKPRNNSHATCECSLKGGETETGVNSNVRTRVRMSLSTLMSKSPIELPGLEEITLAGLGASICSLVIFVFVECLVWKAVTKTNIAFFRHTALVNIATFLLLANVSFLVTSLIQDLTQQHPTMCLVLALAKHLFYLVMFFWMFCLSMILLHQLMFVFSPVMKKTFFFVSIFTGYICPMVTVSVTYMYYHLTHDGSYYDPHTCWLKYDAVLQGSIHAFLLPVGVIVLMNLFTMVKVIVTHLRPQVSAGTVDEREIAKSILKVIAILTPVFGVSWALGFLVFVLDVTDGILPKMVSYAFTITTSLQGLFILLTGILGERKVQNEVSKCVSCVKPERSESTRNFTSSIKKNSSLF